MTATPTPQGSLAGHGFPDLVRDLYIQQWTGAVTLTHAGVGKRIRVQQGRMVFASSTDPDERLGPLLLRRGKISFRQLEDAGRAVAPGRRLGTVLVEREALEPEDLVKAVVDQVQEIIYGAFHWTEGQYRLEDDVSRDQEIRLKINTPDLILEGIRRILAWSRVSRGCGGLKARYARSRGWQESLARMSLPSEQRALVEGLEAIQDVESICHGSSLPDFHVCQTLWALRVVGVVHWLDQPARAEPEIEDEGLSFVVGEPSDGE